MPFLIAAAAAMANWLGADALSASYSANSLSSMMSSAACASTALPSASPLTMAQSSSVAAVRFSVRRAASTSDSALVCCGQLTWVALMPRDQLTDEPAAMRRLQLGQMLSKRAAITMVDLPVTQKAPHPGG